MVGSQRKTFLQRKDVKFPTRRFDAKKGDHGRLLIIGGSEDLVGAPILSAKAAYRATCDQVSVVAPEKVAWAINTNDESIITHKLPGKAFSKVHVEKVLEHAKSCDAVLLGNGLGRGPAQKSFVQDLLKKLDKPLVIDADALYATFFNKMKSKQVICTPHKKEYEVLMKNNKDKIPAHIIILKKGPIDEIITEKKVIYNKTGVPEMSVAGTGDILAGMCASFLAQGLSPAQAASSAAFFNGLAGQRAQKDFGNFTANEILFYIKP